MKCPNADKLLQYYDGVLSVEEAAQVMEHVESCGSCKAVLQLFEQEEQFMQETFAMPQLPDTFDEQVLAQLTPYKKKKRMWKRGLAAAAGLLLAGGITFAVTPSFASFVNSLFGSNSADEGLHMALESGAVLPVNVESTSGKVTLFVEDVLVDTSRIGFTYKVMKQNGKFVDPTIDFWKENTIAFKDMNGNLIDMGGSYSWSRVDEDFGMFLFDLPKDFLYDQFVAELHIKKIGFRSGEWQLTVPFDLTEARKQLKTYVLDETFEYEGVEVQLQDLRFSSSATDFSFNTQYTPDEYARLTKEQGALAAKYGELFSDFKADIVYDIVNAAGEVVASMDHENGHMISGMGSGGETYGGMQWTHSFVPLHNADDLTFVLKGVYKSRPVEATVPVKKGQQLTFEGDTLEVVDISRKKKDHQYLLELRLEGDNREKFGDGAQWRAIADGKRLEAYTSSYYEEDGKAVIELRIHDYQEIPDDVTLALVQIYEYLPLAEPWRVALKSAAK